MMSAFSTYTKDTNPKDAIGTKKVPMFSVVPMNVIGEIALGMMEGGLKYGRHNYREAGVRASVYLDALGRHMGAWWEGEDIDPDSGLSHVTKAITSLVVLRDSMMQGNWVDDRPIKTTNRNWIKDANAKAAAFIEKYPNPTPAYTEVDKNNRYIIITDPYDDVVPPENYD
jgi:hypothetical protein